MKFNFKRFTGLFFLFLFVMMCTGCTASWIGAIQALLPALSAAVSAILAFVMSLENKTVPASVSAAIQKIVTDVQTELGNLATLVASAAKNAGASILSEISTVLNSILTNLSSILSGLSITDSSTIQKITELVGLAVTVVQAILTIIPLATKKLAEQLSEPQLEAFDHATATNIKNTHKAAQAAYHEIVTTPTENTDVNLALNSLPQTLP